MAYDYQLSEEEKRELLRIARSTLREHVRSGWIPPGKPHRKGMLAPGEVIATLIEGDALRSRVGHTRGEEMPLYRAIQNAVSRAAVGAGGQGPVREEEIERLHIEIAVLGPPRRAEGPSDIEPGIHGVAVTLGDHLAVSVPGVALEADLDAEGVLAHTCAQSGADPCAWRETGAVIEVFAAQVFREGDFVAA